MENDNSVLALVRLIEDPDESIYEHVRDELISKGPQIIPILESSWEAEDYGLLFQTRIENLINEIQFISAKNRLKKWIESPNKDLLEGAIIVAQYQYPNVDEDEIKNKVQLIRKDIWLELNEGQTAYEKVRIFNKVFYGKFGFKGNSQNFHSPLNSYINTVLETKKGNPLSLCLLYSVLACSLDMPIHGVNLPNHFILAYMDEYNTATLSGNANEFGVLFYINAFSRGGIFDENEIKAFLKGINKEELSEYFAPCSNTDIIKRMVTNLINSFQQSGSKRKVNELTELRNLFDFEL